jgi:hypothetical protein
VKTLPKWRGFDFLDEKVRTAWTWAGALLGLLWETTIDHIDRPLLLAIFAGILGVPAVLHRPSRPDKPSDSEEQPER